MNILIAPDKFKGSLSATEVCAAIKEGLLSVDSTLNVIELPLADGGEGTCELLTSYAGGSMVTLRVRDPLFRTIDSGYGISKDGKIAFLEMAKASGLQLLKMDERNPMIGSTVGTGDLIRHALDRGAEHIIMGVGGSATTDGGIGMAEALGAYFYDASGERLQPVGANLQHIHSLDLSSVHPRLRQVQFTIFCDVDNPLHGPNGAAYIFSPQKGADARMVSELDMGLRHYERVLENTVHRKVNFPGAGAGGGLPSSIKALANVTVRPGMDYIIEFTKFEEQLSVADMVITGEGKIDEQTLSGKVVKGVADLAARHNKVVVAFAGKTELSEKAFQSLAIRKIITLTGKDISEKQAMEKAYGLLHDRVAIFWRNWEPEAT